MDIKGVKDTIKEFERFGEQGVKTIEDVTYIKSLEIEAQAKRQAPVDKGFLRQNIIAEKITSLSRRIVSWAKYSPYMEFGTGGLVSVPPELKEIAILYKGKGVKKINLHPQPFMYPAFIKARLTYTKDIAKALERLTKRFNG